MKTICMQTDELFVAAMEIIAHGAWWAGARRWLRAMLGHNQTRSRNNTNINCMLGPLALSGLALGLSGCLIIPIPTDGRKETAYWKQQAVTLQNAHATRQQVVCQLGAPVWNFEDLQVLGYKWSGVEWACFWLLAGGYNADAGVCDPTIQRLLWLSFDDQDRLKDWKLGHIPELENRTKWERARRWRESLSPPLATPKRYAAVPPPPGKALVHVIWDRGKSISWVMVVKVDGVEQAEIRKGAFTSLVLDPGHHEIGIQPTPLPLSVVADEVFCLIFTPDKKSAAEDPALTKCSEPEALPRLNKLSFCK
jgi:hypothetical protein